MTSKISPARICRRIACAAVGATALLSIASGRAKAQASSDQRLTPIEQKIRDYVRAHESEQINFLEKAVNISSGTFNLAGVRSVGRLFAPEFASIGFDTTWVTLPDAV